MKQLTYIFLTLFGTTMLIACSSGAGNDTNTAGGGRGGIQNGFLSLAITDAPIDDAAEVWVRFDGVELKPASTENVVTLTFKPPMEINLLALQGQNKVQMLTNATLPAGNYDWIKLKVTAKNDGLLDSYIKLDDNSVHELDIPSGSESGLKIIGGLEVIANTPKSMTIDFDLRKSIVMTGVAQYTLIPVLRLVDDTAVGSIEGTIEVSALSDSDCPDADPSTGNAVYLYSGLNISPDDIDDIDPEPVASVIPTLNKLTGIFEYEFGFIPSGQYTAAFTCEANLDDPMTDDVIIFSRGVKNITLANTNKVSVNAFR
jgi:hypothetical protein